MISVLPAAIVGLRTIAINREGMQAAILELHTNLAIALAETIDDALQSIEQDLEYVSRTLGTQMDWTSRQRFLQSLLDANDQFVSIAIVDQTGQELLKAYNPSLERSPVLVSHRTDPVFTAYRENRSLARGTVYRRDGIPRMDLVHPLGKDHCLYAVVALRPLWDRVLGTRIARSGFAFIVDGQGRTIAHPDPAENEKPATDLPIVKQALSALSVGSCEYRHPRTAIDIVGAYAPIRRLGWGIIIQQDKDEAFVSVHRMRGQAVLLIALSALIVVGVAVFIARGLIRPIAALTTAAHRIAHRDFSPRVIVATHDEIQELAETFNTMTTELERYDRLHVDEVLEEKRRTEAVMFSIADGIVMTDPGGRVQVANAPAKTLLGLPDDGWQDRSLCDLIGNSSMRDAFRTILSDPGQNTRRNVEIELAGTPRHFLLTTGRVITPSGSETIGYVTVLRDITLEKEMDRIKEDFLHSITHDLRNPMTSIRGFLKFLTDEVAGPLTPQQHKMLATMDRASRRLLSLINDILDIAKLESGTLTLTLAQSDFRLLAQRTVEILEALALRKAITVVIDCPETLPLVVADAELIERVYGNLINNALKFTPEQGRIVVTIRDTGDRIVSSVSDTGEGIPAAFLTRIFDKFQQVDGQHKGGTGLGLTICKYIVEAHQGEISVASPPGSGATFTFWIPKGLQPTAPAHPEVSA